MTPLLATATLLVDVGRGLREAFFMFWETLWALVLGFTLSGVVQAFVSRERLRQTMGDHGPAAVARATGFGMVSSSCSYAASVFWRLLRSVLSPWPDVSARTLIDRSDRSLRIPRIRRSARLPDASINIE